MSTVSRVARIATVGVLLAAAGAAAVSRLTAVEAIDPKPVSFEWQTAADLGHSGFGRVRFVSARGAALEAHTYRATGFDPRDGAIWFVLHGAGRDADRYIELAAPVAERHGALAIAIHFSRERFPRGDDYTLWHDASAAAPLPGLPELLAVSNYAEIERVFDGVLSVLGGEQTGYYLFGHSAGAQFVHRLITFLPAPRVHRAVAANAGWYTLPLAGESEALRLPYGLGGAPAEVLDSQQLFATPLVVLAGEADLAVGGQDPLVRGTPAAMAQGDSRFARAGNYYATALAEASRRGTRFAWRFGQVPYAGHSAREMIGSAAFYLFGDQASPCQGTPAGAASHLVITELLADPPPGSLGDANGDGRRDPAEDEFVELYNAGPEPLCLSGWSLGDARRPVRHIFALGTLLAPGDTLLLFGGGLPRGDFGAAQVQLASAGALSLTNRGDTLRIRDGARAPAVQLSWGDCAGATCAADHLPFDLDRETSLIRLAAGGPAQWGWHRDVDERPFSPGAAWRQNNTNGNPL